MHTHFEIYTDLAGEFRWRLVAANGKIVADCGEGYATLSNLERAIADLPTWVAVAADQPYDMVAV